MKSRLAYIFLSYIFLAISCAPTEKRTCSKLRLGEFYYKSKIAFSGSTIQRGDSMQVVTDVETGKKQREKIEWVAPCTYILYSFPDTDSLNPDPFPVRVDVLTVTAKYYTVHVSSDHYKASFDDTVWIIMPEKKP